MIMVENTAHAGQILIHKLSRKRTSGLATAMVGFFTLRRIG